MELPPQIQCCAVKIVLNYKIAIKQIKHNWPKQLRFFAKSHRMAALIGKSRIAKNVKKPVINVASALMGTALTRMVTARNVIIDVNIAIKIIKNAQNVNKRTK